MNDRSHVCHAPAEDPAEGVRSGEREPQVPAMYPDGHRIAGSTNIVSEDPAVNQRETVVEDGDIRETSSSAAGVVCI